MQKELEKRKMDEIYDPKLRDDYTNPKSYQYFLIKMDRLMGQIDIF